MLKGRSRLHVIGVAAIILALGAAATYLLSQSSAEATENGSSKQDTASTGGDAQAGESSDEADAETDGSAEQADQDSSDGQAEEAADSDQDKDGDDEQEEEKAPIPVEVVNVATGAIASYLSASANLVPENDVLVLAEAEGRVASLHVDEGSRVRVGQALAELARDEAEIAVNKARVRADNADLAYQRAAETIEQGLISREEYERLKMEREVSLHEVAEADWRYGKTTIKAPFAGKVTERFVNLGQHVQPGTELFRVADFNPLIARIYVPEKDVLSLAPGRAVRIVLAADEAISFDGAIRQISPIVDTATGTVKVTVEAAHPPATVRPGAFVSINIVREQRDDAVLVPRESVIRELRSAHVFVREGDEAVKKAVTLGLEENEMIEVLSGLDVGEQVIVAGQGGLKPGARIKVL